MNLFTLLIADKCVNTYFHCWTALVQFDSNLLNFVLVIICFAFCLYIVGGIVTQRVELASRMRGGATVADEVEQLGSKVGRFQHLMS